MTSDAFVTPAPPTLLLVGGARAVSLGMDMVERALLQARARGLRTHVTGPAEALAATRSALASADAVSAVDFTEPGATARWALDRTAAGERFDVVFAVQEMAQVAVAETAEAVGAPGNPPEVIHRIRTKDACRRALAAAGFPQPAVRLCADAGEAEAFLRTSAGPWIVKPRDAMGSVGVSLVRDLTGLPAALDLLPDTRPFLVEQYVDGQEFSVEGAFLDGEPAILAVTAKEKVAPPHFVEIGHVMPAPLPAPVREEVERSVRDALRTLGLRTGGFHVELWLTPDGGVVLGEVHGRFGGDWIHRMLEHIVPGLDLFGLLCDDMLPGAHPRRPAPTPLVPVRGAAVRFLTPPPGKLVAVEGWERILAHPDVLHAELTVREGDVIRPVRRSGDRAGHLVVGAADAEGARRLARELADSVRFETVPATV